MVGRARCGSARAMRELSGNEIPDTAPYMEWLAIVGSILVAVLVCAVLFSNGILT